MKYIVFESQFRKVVKENEIDDLDDLDVPDEEESEIQDYGFDIEDEPNEDLTKIELDHLRKKFKLPRIQFGSLDWKKEYEKPYSPIKPTDVPLEKLKKKEE